MGWSDVYFMQYTKDYVYHLINGAACTSVDFVNSSPFVGVKKGVDEQDLRFYG